MIAGLRDIDFAGLKNFQGSLKLLFILGIWSLILVAAVYVRPVEVVQDIGSHSVSVAGLYTPEVNPAFSYAFTDGNATWHLPGIGTGWFIARLRMGFPSGATDGVARVGTTTQHVVLDVPQQIRIYQLLVPADEQGNLYLAVQSSTTQLPTDARRLGVLLDWIQLRSLGATAPPVHLLLSTPVVLLLLSVVAAQVTTRYRWRIPLLLLGSVALATAYTLYRGRFAYHAWPVISPLAVAAMVARLYRMDWPSLTPTLVRGTALPNVRLTSDAWLRFMTSVRHVAPVFVAWRIALWLIGGLGLWYSAALHPFNKSLTTDGNIAERNEYAWRVFVSSWIQWDAHHYQSIALNGYQSLDQHWSNIAFFPLYPVLIRLIFPLAGRHVEIAALLIAHLAFFAALLLLYDLLTRDFDDGVAYRAVVLLLVFPTSFFFGAAYSESLALALVVGAVWAMRRQRWWLAGIMGALLATTRLPGVLIAPVLAVTYLQQHKWQWRAIRPNFLAVLLPPLGLCIFMAFQWLNYRTPFAFLIAQRDWDNHLSLPWTMPYMLVTRLSTSFDWPITLFQIVVWICFIGLTLLAVLRLPLVYGLTVLLLLLPPYLSSWFRSLPRHVLIGFPAFVILAMLTQRPWLWRLVTTVMFLLLVVGIVLFVNGFWVG